MGAVDHNLRAYRLIFEIEVALREFLIARCEPIGGAKWYLEVLTQAQAAKLERLVEKYAGASPSDLRAKDDKKGWASRRAFHPVYFVDFPELGNTFRMRNNAPLGDHLVSGSAAAIADHFDRLLPLRNAVAHNRPVTSGDLQLVESIHAQVCADLGASAFSQFIACPSTESTATEIAELREELVAMIAAIEQGIAVQLQAWTRLKNRWWLESEWTMDAESVLSAFSIFEQYREHWGEEVVGRKRRMQEWVSKYWNEDVGRRAKASLDRDASLSEGHQQ